MTTEKADFTGVQATMLVTLFLRAADAEDAEPILGDRFAAEAVRRIDYDWTKLSRPRTARARFGVALRSKQFDDWTADFLRRHPDATVLQLACGLDTRAFRLELPAAVRWFDVDLPDVIELRRRLYDESDGYRMIASSVTEPSWLDAVPADKPTLVIAEGLVMYLGEPELRLLLRRLTERFPGGEFLFDGAAPWMVRTTQLLKKCLGRHYPYPAFRTAVRDSSDIPRWNPSLRYLDDVATMSRYDLIPDPKVRRTYRTGARFSWYRNVFRVFRTGF